MVALVALCAAFATIGRPALAQAPAASAAGRWEGAISGTVTELAITVTLTAGPKWSGTIDIPAQGASAMPLGDVIVQGSAVRFTLPSVPGDPAFKGTLSPDGTTISGTFTQAGQGIPFKLQRKADPSAAATSALAGFDEFVQSAMKSWGVPGLAIAIVKDGKVVLAKGYGLRNIQANSPVTADTIFAIGSSTKAFTTMAMGILVEEGKLAWDEPVTKYLPKFALKDEVAGKRMTPRDLVTHRSGLPRHDLMWYNAKLSRPELVARLPYLEPNEDFREKFQYQNLMFLTAGHLSAEVAGTSWEDVIRTRILDPIGMKNSNFAVSESQKGSDFATPYTLKDKTAAGHSFQGHRHDGACRLDQLQRQRHVEVAAAESRWRRDWGQTHRRGAAGPGHAPAADGHSKLPGAVRGSGDPAALVRTWLDHRVVPREEARAPRRQHRRLLDAGIPPPRRRYRRRRAHEPERDAAARYPRPSCVGSTSRSRAD